MGNVGLISIRLWFCTPGNMVLQVLSCDLRNSGSHRFGKPGFPDQTDAPVNLDILETVLPYVANPN